MPQIAQQDYIVIAPVGSAETLVLDESDLQYLVGVALY